QTFKDIEIIVVDDLGNDKSIDIAKEYASKDDRIKIIHNEENLKLLRARYEGVKIAKSSYVLFLDPDDYLELNTCEECYNTIKDNKKVDLIFFDAFIINGDHKERKLKIKSQNYQNKYFLKKILKNKNLFWTMWGKVIQKDLYMQAFYALNLQEHIKINMAEDALLYYPLINHSNNIFYLNKNLYNYCINSSSISGKKSISHIQNNINEHELVLKILQNIKSKKNIALLSLIQYFLYEQKFQAQLKINNQKSIFIKKIYFKFLLLLKKYKFKINYFLRIKFL
ncbi:glycosyltransferase family 2 protein, partial [Campylobacter insulaenigrae]|uniref:glycosyltransferase family 2 protein n=1 Tax=Campylobacter insulaenigrae TaxID=260714 RepID=UPI00242ECD75